MLCDYAIRNRFAAFLIDTYHKVGRSLLDHVDLEALVRIAERCRGAGVKLRAGRIAQHGGDKDVASGAS
jgi:hypothetical protein